MIKASKLNFEDALFTVNATVVEKTTKIGKNVCITTVSLDGVTTAMRVINGKGTKYFTK